MAQLNQFNGGLNTRIAPHLINSNEAQVYTNVDNTSVSLRPIKDNKDENTAVSKCIYNFKDNWISSVEYRTYQEFQENLYYSDGLGIPQKSSNDGIWQNLGIGKPSVEPRALAMSAGVLNGTIQYCYTYYDANDGTESMPSDYTNSLSVTNQSIDIKVEASDDTQVTNIRLYRVGGSITDMQLVKELSNSSATYVDNTLDLDIPGSLLDSYINGQAPLGLKYLTENNAMLFGAVKDKLYYSDIAFINSWSPFNFIDFDNKITGLGTVANGLLVFTEFKTYIITGNSPTLLSKYLLNANHGCIDHKSIKYVSNNLIWLSLDGVCITSGGEVAVISRDKLKREHLSTLGTLTDTIVYDEVYYIGHSGGILAIDFRFGVIFRLLDIVVEGFHNYNNKIYFSKDGKLYSLGTSTDNKSFIYKSPKLADGQMSNLKNYKNVYLNCTGDLQIKIYIDGILVTTKNIDSSTSEILTPQRTRQGYFIEFEVSGKGELLELQYITEGRQNGR